MKSRPHKVNVITLGCSKNLVDSEVLMKQIEAQGIEVLHNSDNNDARTIIPCTETSGGRTSGEAPHPLSDKLQYVAKDYLEFGGSKNTYFEKYKELLEKWCASHFTHSKAQAILKYITKGRVIEDLISQSILINDDNGKLKKKPKKLNKDDPEIFTVLNEQSEAFVRWEVETPNDPCSKIWKDKTDFKTLILNDKDILAHLGRKKVEEIFDVDYHLKYISAIFDRVFGESG